jgi:rhomboid protease GluP
MKEPILSGPASPAPSVRVMEKPATETSDNRSALFERPPFVSLGLLAIMAAVFGAMWVIGKGNISLIASPFGSKINEAIREGQVWRFVTPIFLHGNISHLIVNALSLLWLGVQMESIYGSRKYFLIYMTAGVAGNIASFYRSPEPSLGASGAIFGLIGAGLIFPLRYRNLMDEATRSRILTQLLIVTVANLAIGLVVPHVDNWAHMGGLIGGAFVALFLLPDVLDERPASRARSGALWLATLLFLGVIGWAAASQWPVGVREWRSISVIRAPQMVTYRPQGAYSWWRIDVPKTWKREQDYWRSPQGAILRATDSLEAPQFAAMTLALLQKAGQGVTLQQINGRPATRMMLNNPKFVFDISMMAARKQVVMVWLECRPEVYPQVQRDMVFILNSLRILREPTDVDALGTAVREPMSSPLPAAPPPQNPAQPGDAAP